MDENGRWLFLFLGWCAILVGLLLYWIGWRSETAAWGALAWAGYGVWRIFEQSRMDEAKAERESERRTFPYTATEEQRERIKRLCHEIEQRENWSLADWQEKFGRYPLIDLEKISEIDATLTILDLNQKLSTRQKSA